MFNSTYFETLVKNVSLQNKNFNMKLIEKILLAQAKRLATDVIFLNKGKVLEQTVSKTFFKSPKTLEAQKYINGEILI